jgi:hypothetical protein
MNRIEALIDGSGTYELMHNRPPIAIISRWRHRTSIKKILAVAKGLMNRAN